MTDLTPEEREAVEQMGADCVLASVADTLNTAARENYGEEIRQPITLGKVQEAVWSLSFAARRAGEASATRALREENGRLREALEGMARVVQFIRREYVAFVREEEDEATAREANADIGGALAAARAALARQPEQPQ